MGKENTMQVTFTNDELAQVVTAAEAAGKLWDEFVADAAIAAAQSGGGGGK